MQKVYERFKNMIFIPLAKYAKKAGFSRDHIYKLIRKNKLIKGKDYIAEPTYHIGIKIREDLDIKKL